MVVTLIRTCERERRSCIHSTETLAPTLSPCKYTLTANVPQCRLVPQWNIRHLHSMWEARGHADHHRLLRHPSRALPTDSVRCQARSANQRKRSCESTRLGAALGEARWIVVCEVVICTTRSLYSCSKHEGQAPGCRLHSINQCVYQCERSGGT